MKVYILLRDCNYCDGNIIGVFLNLKDASDMRKSFKTESDQYVIDVQEVIK